MEEGKVVVGDGEVVDARKRGVDGDFRRGLLIRVVLWTWTKDPTCRTKARMKNNPRQVITRRRSLLKKMSIIFYNNIKAVFRSSRWKLQRLI
jgi:sigma54-dependent transcription regulator